MWSERIMEQHNRFFIDQPRQKRPFGESIGVGDVKEDSAALTLSIPLQRQLPKIRGQ
jgi:hypothetical protein